MKKIRIYLLLLLVSVLSMSCDTWHSYEIEEVSITGLSDTSCQLEWENFIEKAYMQESEFKPYKFVYDVSISDTMLKNEDNIDELLQNETYQIQEDVDAISVVFENLVKGKLYYVMIRSDENPPLVSARAVSPYQTAFVFSKAIIFYF